VIEGFCRNAVRSGIDIMRIFDALNDVDNMKSTIRFVKENGGLADCAVCYTVDPKFPLGERAKAALKGKKLPGKLFGTKYFVRKAKELAALGADMITIKDMAGLIDPWASAELIGALKSELGIPVDLHTHCTPGYGVASVLMAMVKGVDIVDTVVLSFSGGPAAPAFEIVQAFADRLGLDTGVDLQAVRDVNSELAKIRGELAKFDQYKMLPPPWDYGAASLPSDLDALVEEAVSSAKAGRIQKCLDSCQKIEKWCNYPDPDEIVKHAQIPGGMYTNMMAQLKEAKLEHLVERVLKSVPRIRVDAGCPPLVTPTSQIVGVQAVNCIVDETQGKPFYTNNSKNFVDLVKGTYGRTPWPVDPEFRLKIAGVRDETPYDTSKHRKPDNPILPELGGARLAKDEKEELLLDLFPSVADKYLRGVREAEYAAYAASLPPEPEPIPSPYPDSFWEGLTLAVEG
jgi:pyruvate/oxaloacetate carboxyltransferase